MRRIIIYLLIIVLCSCVVFCFYGCGDLFSKKNSGNSEESTKQVKEDGKIELTTENVNTYLKCTVQTYTSDYSWKTGIPASIKSILTVRAISSNYEYKDVVIRVNLEGVIILSGGSRKRFTQELQCRLDIAGNGTDSATAFADDFTGKRGSRIDGVTGTQYSIEYVSGYIEKA